MPFGPLALGDVKRGTQHGWRSIEFAVSRHALQPARFSGFGSDREFIPTWHGVAFLPAQTSRADEFTKLRQDHFPEIHFEQLFQRVTEHLLPEPIDIAEAAVLMDERDRRECLAQGVKPRSAACRARRAAFLEKT